MQRESLHPFIEKMHFVNRELTKTTSHCLVQEEFQELGLRSIPGPMNIISCSADRASFHRSRGGEWRAAIVSLFIATAEGVFSLILSA